MIYLISDLYRMKRNPWISREKLDRIRIELLQEQIRNISINIPFYQKIFKESNLIQSNFKEMADLRKLPIVTKEDIQENVDEFLNKNLDSRKFFKSHTSGSTGQPFWSFFDRRSWIRKKYISKLRARMTCGMRLGEKVAIFESEPVDELESLNNKQFARNFLFKVIRFSIFENLEKVFTKLSEFKPQNVYGPPNFFFQLAQFVTEKNLSLSFLKRIYTSSEYLEFQVRKVIENVFQADIFDVYGSTEFKEIAWECSHHQGYHLNEDEVICEILNENEPAPLGEAGDIVLTDLRNRAMPLIRYRIKDRGRFLEEKCTCGRTFSLIMPIAGRASEYIQLPSGEKLSPFLFTTSIEKIEGLIQYQLIQISENDLTVNVILLNGTNKDAFLKIEKILNNITKGLMRISILECKKISVEENGKLKVVKSLVQDSLLN